MKTLSDISKETKIFEPECMFCQKKEFVKVNCSDYFDWLNGELIQNAFPYLTVDQREILISGMCGKCFDGSFGGSSDD